MTNADVLFQILIVIGGLLAFWQQRQANQHNMQMLTVEHRQDMEAQALAHKQSLETEQDERKEHFDNHMQTMQTAYMKQIDTLIEQRDKSERDKNQLDKELKAAIDTATWQGEKASNLETELIMKDNMIEQLRETIRQSNELVKKAMDELQSSSLREGKLEGRMEALQMHLESVTANLSGLRSDLEKAHQQLEVMILEKQATEQQLRDSRNENEEALKENQKLYQLIEDLQAKVKELESQNNALQQRVKELENLNAKSEQEKEKETA